MSKILLLLFLPLCTSACSINKVKKDNGACSKDNENQSREEELYQMALKQFPNNPKLARNYAQNKLKLIQEEAKREEKLAAMNSAEKEEFLKQEKEKKEEVIKIITDV